MRTLLNLGCFQGTWLVAVFGAATGRVWPGVVALAVAIAVQSAPRVPVKVPSIGILAISAAIGLAVDSALVLAELISFPERARAGWPPPVWMSVLWINFATTLDESLAWAGERPIAAAVAGAAGGPLTYLAGQAAGVVRLESGPVAVVALAILWALVFPALAALAKSLRGRALPAGRLEPEGRAT